MNIAILFIGIGDVSGGGGAERFFADFFTDYKNDERRKHDLYLLTDEISIKQFNKINKITDGRNVLLFKTRNNRFKNILEFISISRWIRRKRIEMLLIPLYNIHYYPLIKRIAGMRESVRPKLVPVIVDYNISYYYFDNAGTTYNFKRTFEGLFSDIRIDGIITWYRSFKEFCKNNAVIKSDPEVYTINSRYSPSAEKVSFQGKANKMVFAGRLTPTKRPLMFLEAINKIKGKTGNWKFAMYGKGPLEAEMKEYIHINGLEDLVTLSSHSNPKEVFAGTKCFVSTQDFENFPSLAMNEAMLMGNAIIARNVGQTDLFVKEGINGYLLKEDSASGLADIMLQFINSEEKVREEMGEASYRLTQTVHTYTNFKSQMETIWESIRNGN